MKKQAYFAMEGMERVAAVILRRLEHDVCNYDYVLPKGWRCVVKILDNWPGKDGELEKDYTTIFHLDIQSNKGGGSWAQAKLQTMETIPGFEAASSPIDMKVLLGMAKNHPSWEQCPKAIKEEISNATHVDNLSPDAIHWIVNVDNGPGIAPGYGGITVPYECLVAKPSKDGGISQRKGLIRIGFSGASQEQDLMFATFVLGSLMDAGSEIFPDAQAWYNLREIKKIPAINLWLDLLGIKEA